MNNSLRSIVCLTLFATSLISGAVFAQVPTQPAQGGGHLTGYLPNQVALHYFKPEPAGVDLDELLDAATRIFGRTISVRSKDGNIQQAIRFFRIGNSIAVYDIPESAERILTELPKMARAANEDSPTGSEWNLTEVKLKHIAADKLSRALRDLLPRPRSAHRRVATTTMGTGARRLAISPNNNSIIIRDTKENTARITALIAQLDVPKPPRSNTSVAMDIWILSGDEEDQFGVKGKAPESLMKYLLPLFPGKKLNLIGRGLVAAKVGGKDIQLTQTLADDMSCELSLSSIEEGSTPNSLAVSRLAFELVKQLAAPKDGSRTRSNLVQPYRLSTAAELTIDEYTVIASFGASPYMLVVRPRRTR